VPQVRLILSNGENGGVMATHEALKLAQNEGLDLIEINPKATPPVCRVADFGKLLYDAKKQQQEEKKKQRQHEQELKELACRPNTDSHDFSRLIEQARQFLTDKNRVRFTIKFRGREISHQEIGRNKLEKLINDLSDIISANAPISLEGKNMIVILSPK
jgi:translation initiation factor IF-3